MIYLTVMNDKDISWQEVSSHTIFKTLILDIKEKKCISPENLEKTFTTVKARDWVMIIPEVQIDSETYFLMVKQWRFGIASLSEEFPGGVIDPGETPMEAAIRELKEETGYIATEINEIANVSPNPAIMENRQYVFVAKCEQKPSTDLHLDENEFINVSLQKRSDVIKNFGKPPYDHSLHCAGLFYYLKYRKLL